MELKRCKTAVVAKEERDSRQLGLSEAPAEILVEILMRLPHCKQAFQFKLVSKRWNSILSDPDFFRRAAAFHRQCGGGESFFTLIFQVSTSSISDSKKTPVLAVEVPKSELADGHVRRLNLDRIIGGGPSSSSSKEKLNLKIAASCNDILLVEHEHQNKYEYYYVVNVQTHEWIALPPPPSKPDDAFALGNDMCFKAGLLCHYDYHPRFCFSFKVIRILSVSTTTVELAQTLPIKGLDRPEFSVHIYSSDSKQWCQYTADWYPFRLTHYLTKTPIVSHNGMFHWVNGRALLSLNPFYLVFDHHHRLTLSRTVELPEKNFLDDPEIGIFHDSRYDRVSKFMGIGVVRDHLRIVTEQIDGESDGGHRRLLVWQLDDSKFDGPWSLVHNVLISEFPFKRILRSFNFLACHPYEGDVLLVQILNSVYQIDLHTQKLRKPTGKPVQGNCFLRNVLPPLLHRWFPTPLTSLSRSPNSPL